jgi:hypothetical protein
MAESHGHGHLIPGDNPGEHLFGYRPCVERPFLIPVEVTGQYIICVKRSTLAQALSKAEGHPDRTAVEIPCRQTEEDTNDAITYRNAVYAQSIRQAM